MTAAHRAGYGGLRAVGTPVVLSAALVVPLILLQWFTRRAFQEGFPVLLFSFMTGHALLIVLSLTPGLRRLRATGGPGALTPGHWAGLLVGAFLLYVYAGVVIDQLPCFLGAPNCD